MTPVLVSVDRAGDLKLGKRKCRLHKKADVVKVAKKYDVPNAEKKTVQQLCGSIKARAKASNDGMNNVPLAKLYPEAARKRTEKKALDRKIAANFMKAMTVKIPAPRPKPRSPNPAAVARARANIKNVINKRVSYMNSDSQKMINQASPRAVMRIARELRRLR